jgi:dihydroorotate dehydrogenase (fumarate)
MDLSTTYLGMHLSNPLMPGASPMVDSMDTVRRLEDAGAAAIVMHSLFEEQIKGDELFMDDVRYHYAYNSPEASHYLPPPAFALGPDEYLQHIRRIKEAVAVPVIASLNGVTHEGWLDYARLIQQAGADALELNVYYLAADPSESASDVDSRVLDIVGTVRRGTLIPIAVKLSPFYSSLAHLIAGLERMGAEGFVLFNRFYQPDIDPEILEVVPRLHFSESSELRLRLRWVAMLSGRMQGSLAVSGGVHSALDAVKALMAGAHAVQMVSALLQHGSGHLAVVLRDLRSWMEEHEYISVRQLQGSMSLDRCPNPGAFERANYMRILQSWRVA